MDQILERHKVPKWLKQKKAKIHLKYIKIYSEKIKQKLKYFNKLKQSLDVFTAEFDQIFK